MKAKRKNFLRLFKEAFFSWARGKVPRLGAALAFYTIFAIAPLFIIALAISGFWFGEEAARGALFGQLQGLIGQEGGEAVKSIVTAAGNRPKTGMLATAIALLTLCVGSTGVFVELQDALNTIWNVQRDRGHGVWNFFRNRLLSFAMVLGIGFLLLVSLVLSAMLAAMGRYFAGLGPDQKVFWEIVNFVLSLGIITMLFAMIFKILPDVKIVWRDVWVGAFITAILFNFGKFLIGFYLGRSTVTSAYGAAGSLIILLLWVYYAAQILFLGAELTRAYANEYGAHLQPARGARFTEPMLPAHKTPRRAAAS